MIPITCHVKKRVIFFKNTEYRLTCKWADLTTIFHSEYYLEKQTSAILQFLRRVQGHECLERHFCKKKA